MKKKLFISSIACLSVIVFAYAFVWAQGMKGPKCDGTGPKGEMGAFHHGKMGPRGNPCMMLKNHAKEIGLTEEQLAKIENLCTEAEKAKIDLRAKIDTLRVDMRTEMEKANPDREVVFKLHDEINVLRGELGKIRLTLMLDIKDLLTPEQKAKCKELRERKMMKMKNRIKGDIQEFDEPEEF